MVDHDVVFHGPRYGSTDLVIVNGHEPVIHTNLTLGRRTVKCWTCDWTGPDRRGRWIEKVYDDWRTHAGDVAVGITVEHGQPHQPGQSRCHCRRCRQGDHAQPAARTVVTATARARPGPPSMTPQPTSPPRRLPHPAPLDPRESHQR